MPADNQHDVVIKARLDPSGIAEGGREAESSVREMGRAMEDAAAGASSAMDRAASGMKKVEDQARKTADATKKVGESAGKAADAIERKLGNALKSAAMQAAHLGVNLAAAVAAANGADETAAYISGIGGGIVSGAASGMAFGPWGAAIGGVVGGAVGGVTTYFNREKAEREAAASEAERRRQAEEREAERRRTISANASLSLSQGLRSIGRDDDRDALLRQIQSWKDAIADTDMRESLGLSDAFSADSARGLLRALVKAAEERLSRLPEPEMEEIAAEEAAPAGEAPRARGAASRSRFDSLARIGGSLGGGGLSALSGTERRLDLQTRVLEQCRDAMRQVADYARSPIASFA